MYYYHQLNFIITNLILSIISSNIKIFFQINLFFGIKLLTSTQKLNLLFKGERITQDQNSQIKLKLIDLCIAILDGMNYSLDELYEGARLIN